MIKIYESMICSNCLRITRLGFFQTSTTTKMIFSSIIFSRVFIFHHFRIVRFSLSLSNPFRLKELTLLLTIGSSSNKLIRHSENNFKNVRSPAQNRFERLNEQKEKGGCQLLDGVALFPKVLRHLGQACETSGVSIQR